MQVVLQDGSVQDVPSVSTYLPDHLRRLIELGSCFVEVLETGSSRYTSLEFTRHQLFGDFANRTPVVEGRWVMATHEIMSVLRTGGALGRGLAVKYLAEDQDKRGQRFQAWLSDRLVDLKPPAEVKSDFSALATICSALALLELARECRMMGSRARNSVRLNHGDSHYIINDRGWDVIVVALARALVAEREVPLPQRRSTNLTEALFDEPPGEGYIAFAADAGAAFLERAARDLLALPGVREVAQVIVEGGVESIAQDDSLRAAWRTLSRRLETLGLGRSQSLGNALGLSDEELRGLPRFNGLPEAMLALGVTRVLPRDPSLPLPPAARAIETLFDGLELYSGSCPFGELADVGDSDCYVVVKGESPTPDQGALLQVALGVQFDGLPPARHWVQEPKLEKVFVDFGAIDICWRLGSILSEMSLTALQAKEVVLSAHDGDRDFTTPPMHTFRRVVDWIRAEPVGAGSWSLKDLVVLAKGVGDSQVRLGKSEMMAMELAFPRAEYSDREGRLSLLLDGELLAFADPGASRELDVPTKQGPSQGSIAEQVLLAHALPVRGTDELGPGWVWLSRPERGRLFLESDEGTREEVALWPGMYFPSQASVSEGDLLARWYPFRVELTFSKSEGLLEVGIWHPLLARGRRQRLQVDRRPGSERWDAPRQPPSTPDPQALWDFITDGEIARDYQEVTLSRRVVVPASRRS